MKIVKRNIFLLVILLTASATTAIATMTKAEGEANSTTYGVVWIKFDCLYSTPGNPVPMKALNELQEIIYPEYLPLVCEEGNDITCAAQYWYTTDYGDPWTPVLKTGYDEYSFNPFYYAGEYTAMLSYLDDVKCTGDE